MLLYKRQDNAKRNHVTSHNPHVIMSIPNNDVTKLPYLFKVVESYAQVLLVQLSFNYINILINLSQPRKFFLPLFFILVIACTPTYILSFAFTVIFTLVFTYTATFTLFITFNRLLLAIYSNKSAQNLTRSNLKLYRLDL